MEIEAAWSWSCTVAVVVVGLVVVKRWEDAVIYLPSCDRASTMVDFSVPSCVSIS